MNYRVGPLASLHLPKLRPAPLGLIPIGVCRTSVKHCGGCSWRLHLSEVMLQRFRSSESQLELSQCFIMPRCHEVGVSSVQLLVSLVSHRLLRLIMGTSEPWRGPPVLIVP